jgi:hypothetical protein
MTTPERVSNAERASRAADDPYSWLQAVDAAAASPPAGVRFQSPPHSGGASSGKSGTGVGFEGGVGEVRGETGDSGKVRVRVVDMESDRLCYAPIGSTGQKVCLAPLLGDGVCSKYKTHKGAPGSWKAAGEPFYVIPLSSEAPDVACLAPILPVTAVFWVMDTKSLREDVHTPAGWAPLFGLYGSRRIGDEGDSVPMSPERADLLTKTPIKLSLGPYRGSPMKVELATAGLDKPTDECVAALVTDVASLNDTLYVAAKKTMEAELEQTAAIEGVADKVNMIQKELGDRGSSTVPTLWAGVGAANDAARVALDRAKEEIKEVRAENQDLRGVVTRQADDLQAALAVMRSLGERLETTESRLLLVANHQRRGGVVPRDDLDSVSTAGADGLQALARRVLALEEAGFSRSGEGGCGGGACRFTADRSAQLTRIGDQVSALEIAIKSEAVSVGQVVLKDLAEAKAYADMAGLPEEMEAFQGVAHLAIQPLLLLDLVHAVKLAPESNTVSKIKNQQTVGMTDFEAVAARSISNLIPALFGNGLKADELSELPTYESFHEPNTIHGSLLDLVMTGITEVEASVNQQIEDAQVKAGAKLMLRSCLAESKSFVHELFTFMRRFHERYTPVLPPKEVWAILQYLVRAIFDDLRRKMTAASGVKWGDAHRSSVNAGKLLWSTFQVLKEARTFVFDYAAGWEGHPTLSPAINKFLLKNVVMKPTLEVFKLDVELAKRDASEAKKLAEAARGAVARGQGDAAKKANKDKGQQ